ncbi:MAG: TetR/AcrR family transcriptional regulator [Candidatus Binataceae bacterium]
MRKRNVHKLKVSVRPSRVSPDKSRTILREAMKLFLKKGYGAVSMNEIRSRVGGSKTTLYSRFHDKAGLFAAVIDGLLSEIVDFNRVLDVAHLNVEEALLRIARQHLETAMSDRYIRLIRVVAAEVHQFPELGRTFYEHGPGRSYANFAAWLTQQNAAGTLAISDVRLATDFFFGALLHRRVLARTYGVLTAPPPDIGNIAHAVVAEFLAAYGRRESGQEASWNSDARPV